MEYFVFQNRLKEEVSAFLGEDYIVEIKEVRKNNGVILRGISLGEKDALVSPIIYLEGLYQRYLNGERITSLTEDIARVYNSALIGRDPFQKMDMEFDTWKDRITFRLVSYEKNKDSLKNMPYMPYLDLAVIFYLVHDNKEDVLESIRIDNNILGNWNVSVGMLYAFATENTPKFFPIRVDNLSKVILDSMKAKGEVVQGGEVDFQDSFIIMTNQQGVNGAAVILYENALEDIAERLNSDFYLLPSSIHEVIILPLGKQYDIRMLTEMVFEINQNKLEEEDVLSNHAYIYQRKEGVLKL